MFWYLLAILVGVLFYKIIIKPHRFWKEKGVKCLKPILLFGDKWQNMSGKETIAGFVQRVYTAFPKERFSGIYQMLSPILIIKDPELIKQITVKDFDHFTDHLPVISNNSEAFWTKNSFFLKGEAWRGMRSTLSPAFTSNKMKAMFILMSECAEQFAANLTGKQENTQTIELKDTFTRYANDIIATCGFGFKCDSLGEQENTFFLMGKALTDFSGFWTIIKITISSAFPKVTRLFQFRIFPKQVYQFFLNLISETVKIREEQAIVRPDMIHLLMEARKGSLVHEQQQDSKDAGFATVEESDVGRSKTKHKITLEDISAQILGLFFGAFETTATLLCFMGYELAVNPDIQERLRNEIDDTLRECNGKITYEALNKMKYLDMIIAESLRKWPPLPSLDRRCVQPYTIKSQQPNEPSVTLNKGDAIWLPVWGLHHDPQYYPEPERFDPERFSDENKSNIKPYTYLPFGGGPRNCIGSRFALLETKIVYFHLLSKFEIVVIEKSQVPVKLSTFSVNAENGFWFGLKKRV